jgi:hypothetical protein
VGIVPLETLLVCTVDKRGAKITPPATLASTTGNSESNGPAKAGHTEKKGLFFFALRGEPGKDGKPGKVKGCKTKNGVVVEGNHTEYLFRSDSAEQVKDWIQCIEINLTQLKGNHGYNFAESYIRNSTRRLSGIDDDGGNAVSP